MQLVTAHGRNSIDRLDWASLARQHQTLAFYLAVSKLTSVQHNLMAHGRPAATPVAIVENGARPERRVLTGRLDRLHDLAAGHSLESPAMVYVGEVARLADRLVHGASAGSDGCCYSALGFGMNRLRIKEIQ